MTILLSPWFWLALATAACSFTSYGWLHSHDAFTSFKSQQEALANQAQERTDNRIKTDKLTKEKYDAQNAADRLKLDATIASLRNKRGADILPAAPTSSRSPDLACFDRTLLHDALRDFVAGTEGLVIEGAQAQLDLNTAKGWAQSK